MDENQWDRRGRTLINQFPFNQGANLHAGHHGGHNGHHGHDNRHHAGHGIHQGQQHAFHNGFPQLQQGNNNNMFHYENNQNLSVSLRS